MRNSILNSVARYTTDQSHGKVDENVTGTHYYVSGSDVNSGQIYLAVERGTYSPKNTCHLSTNCGVKTLQTIN
jgi:hypothetical protein